MGQGLRDSHSDAHFSESQGSGSTVAHSACLVLGCSASVRPAFLGKKRARVALGPGLFGGAGWRDAATGPIHDGSEADRERNG